MDVEHFLSTYGDEAWANEPFIYCCRQEPQIPSKFYYRCGAAGLQLFPDADRPYQASENSRRGLSGRMQQYIGHIRPNIFKIFAAIRIKRQVVALPQHRTGEGEGETYNITKGNMSAVRAAEMTMHHYLDADRNIKRYAPHPESELFQPSVGVEQLLANMRKVQGLQMLLFDARSWRDDTLYDGGEAPPANLVTRDTTARKTPARATEQSLVIKMSRSGIEQLRAGNPTAYKRLMNLMREAYREENPKADDQPTDKQTPPPTVPRATVTGLRATDQATRARAAFDLAEAVLPRPRATTRAQTRAAAAADQPIATRTRARAQA